MGDIGPSSKRSTTKKTNMKEDVDMEEEEKEESDGEMEWEDEDVDVSAPMDDDASEHVQIETSPGKNICFPDTIYTKLSSSHASLEATALWKEGHQSGSPRQHIPSRSAQAQTRVSCIRVREDCSHEREMSCLENAHAEYMDLGLRVTLACELIVICEITV